MVKTTTKVATTKPAKKSPADKPIKKTANKPTKVVAVVKDQVASATPAPSEDKLNIISEFQVKQGDTGSPEVQVALLTSRIEKLVSHLKTNPSDNHSRRGLLGIVSKRRRLLNYLADKDEKRYKVLVKKIGLK